MKILLTGSNGFIGKNVHNNFINTFDLTSISTSDENNNRVLVSKNFENIYEILFEHEYDCIIHLAAVVPVSFSEATFESTFYPNALMMDNIFKFAINKKISTFIYLSTFGSMEDYKNLKMKDYYTLSKVHGEHVCSMMEKQGIRAIALRVPSPYGEFSTTPNVINQFITKALNNETINVYGTGKREQNFVYIKDLIDAIKYFIVSPVASGVYEIVSNQNINMLELAELIVNICNSKSKITIGTKPDIQESFKPNYDYLTTLSKTGFSTKFTLKEGLEDYISILKKSK